MSIPKTVPYLIVAVVLFGLSAACYGEISATNRAAIDRMRQALSGAPGAPGGAAHEIPSYAVKSEKVAIASSGREKTVRRPECQAPAAASQAFSSLPAGAAKLPPSVPKLTHDQRNAGGAAVKAPSPATQDMAKEVPAAVRQPSPAAAPAPLNQPAAAGVRPPDPASAVSPQTPPAPAGVIVTDECYDVVIDPGHGGRYEPARAWSGDHWDPFSKTFLLPYNFGASSNGIYEHEWTLETAKKVEEILKLTHTDAGFAEFMKILQRHADIYTAKVKRVRVNTHLTRRYSWEDDPEKNAPNVNKKYRLFDSPDSFSPKGGPSEKMYPGRISFINQLSPDLVVCLHNNSSPNRNVRGFSSVIVPHFDFFSTINAIVTNGLGNGPSERVKVNEPKYQKVANFITSAITRPDKIDVKTIVSDTATYFTGFRAFTQKFIGLRYLMVTWRYNTTSPLTSFMLFFMRENSVYEYYRRSGGPEGYGGDNFYSSEEIIRYIRAALWDDFKSSNGGYAAKTSVEEYAGSHASPFVSDWAIPLHVNAITAYVELGYLSNARDRKLLKEKQAVIAESVAVGIYSLLAGLKPKKTDGVETPRGEAIDFAKYGRDKNSNGYFNISCRPLAF